VGHHCCHRLPRDHARKRAQGATLLPAFDTPMPLSLQYTKGGGATRDFPVSAITDCLYARNQFNPYLKAPLHHRHQNNPMFLT
jgi:hypothetical protein